MLTPAPALLPVLTLADRFWSYGAGAVVEAEDAPEPLRSVMIVRHFLTALERIDTTSPRKAAAAMVAMLRQAEIDGDLSYASPEQVRGEILDTRSVVFSLGVVLFERLTGRHPFGAENNRPRRIDRIRKGELGSGVNSFPTVAQGLRAVLVRAMSPFPEERWPDLRQMRELLGAFLAQEAPAPRLPGTDAPAEDTRVVRMATDFGRELMQVVAKNDLPPPRGTVRSSQRLVIPTSGLSSVTGASSPRRVTQPSPVIEPTSDSVVTRVHFEQPQAAQDDSQPVITPKAEPPKAEPSSALTAAAPAIARTRSPRPTPPRVAGPPRSPADTRAALAASLPTLPPLPSPPPVFELPLPAPPDSMALLPAPPRRGRAIVLAGIGAAIGGTAALSLFLALGSSSTTTASAVSPSAAPTTPAPAPATPPALTPTPAAVTPDTPAPAVVEPAAPAPTLHEEVAAAIAPCIGDHDGRFGLSLLFRYSIVAKPYYGSGDGLSAAEHGCLGKALKGQSFTGAPKSEVLELKIRVSHGAVTVSPWK